jgi:hypothetical protein
MRGTLVTLVMCEQSAARHTPSARAGPTTSRRSTPLIQGTIPKPDVLTSEPIVLEPRKGTLTLKAYAPSILLAEATFDGISLFDEDVAELRDRALTLSRQRLTEEGGLDVERWSEEYAVYVVSEYDGPPEELVDRDRMAALLKSERLPLDPAEVDYTLSVRFKYARHDLVVVDWDGALVFDPEGDVAWAMELLELGNLQLLRYRLLDRELDGRLRRVAQLVEEAGEQMQAFFKASEIRRALGELMRLRSQSIADFQDVERETKLIGDWYAARLYEQVTRRFRLDDWRRAVKEKLDGLASIYATAADRFTVSWERRARWIELVAWYVLLIGWSILLVLDFYARGH